MATETMRAPAEFSLPPFVFDLFSDETKEKLEKAVGMIQLVRDVVSKQKTVEEALAEIGITSDAVIDKIQGCFQRSESRFLHVLSETEFTQDLVGAAMDIGSTLQGFLSGVMSAEDCVEQLFDRGFEGISTAISYTLKVITIPDHVPAPLMKLLELSGATFCYESFEWVINSIAASLKEAREAKRDRILIEQQCAKLLSELMQTRVDIRQLTEQYFTEHYETFEAGFAAIDRAILRDDIDGFIQGNSILQEILGHHQQFQTMKEFDALMDSDEAFIL